MTGNDNLLTVGHIRKAHGLTGEVVVRLSTNRDERVATGAVLVADGVELVVESSRPKDGDYLVRFEGISERNAADALRGTELLAEPLDDPDELWAHELIGAVVVDHDGSKRGTVAEVQSNPASDLMVLDNEALVPVTFVVDFAPANGDEPAQVFIEAPDGLFDL